MEGGDLQAHPEAPPDLRLAREEVRDDDQLAMTGAERVNHPVGEGEPEADQQRQRGLAIADRPHVPGDQPVGLALEGEQRAPHGGDRGEVGFLPSPLARHRRIGSAGEGIGPGRAAKGEAHQQHGDQQQGTMHGRALSSFHSSERWKADRPCHSRSDTRRLPRSQRCRHRSADRRSAPGRPDRAAPRRSSPRRIPPPRAG